MKVIEFETIDSTNSEMRRRIESGELRPAYGECVLISARHQSGGRGRMGRVFESNDESGIYMTIAYRSRKQAQGAVAVTSSVGVIVARAIRELTGTVATIKWVNDIYIDDKKVCGILAEGCFPLDAPGEFYVIVGIGINLTSEGMSEAVRDIASGIADMKSRKEREELRTSLIDTICAATEEYVAKEDFADYYDDYVNFSNCIGKEVTYIDGKGSFEGRAVGIDSNGALLVERDNRVEVLSTGEISLRIKRG